MDAAASVLAIAAAVAIGAMSPGPSFLLVARTAVSASRASGFATALGMGVGGLIFAVAALLGLQVGLASVPWPYVVIKALGGSYLVYLGWLVWRGARRPLMISEEERIRSTHQLRRSFAFGLATQLSNPKAAVAYASIFTALLPRQFPPAAMLAVTLLVFVVEAGWYAIVALALSSATPRAAYLHHKAWVDRTVVGVMMQLGGKSIATVWEP